ncbi:MAG: hypothetical protein IJN19_05710 [Opitutales bacterium]|nr:hypothetical protein [Opitutales bacterium]
MYRSLFKATIAVSIFSLCGNVFACGGVACYPQGLGVISYEHFEKLLAESVTCKYCGRSASSAKQLSALGVCPNSPSKKHVAQRCRKTRQIYVCRYCGFRANSIRTLTASPCRANPNGSRHVAAD